MGSRRVLQQPAANWLRFSPDGAQLVASSLFQQNEADGPVFIWSASSGELERKLDIAGSVKPVMFASDGRLIVPSGRQISVWNAGAGKIISVHTEHKSDIAAASLLSDHTIVTGGDAEGEVVFTPLRAK